MRLAMLSHLASSGAPTGAERSLALLAGGLRERRHEVTVVAPGPWSLAGELEGAGVRVVEVPCRMAWLAYFDPIPRTKAALKWLRFAWPDPGSAKLESFLRRGAHDVVHVNCIPHVRGAAAARRAGRPVVWHVREILPPGARRRWFAGRIRRSAEAVVAVSRATSRWLLEEGLGERVRVVVNGVPPQPPAVNRQAARRALGLPEEGFAAGLFGQLLPHKGAGAFLDAARLVVASHPGALFVLAGPAPASTLAALDARLADPALAGRVFRLPPQPDGARFLEAVDAIILATTTPDPLPRSVLEGMAAGKPVAAFRSGGVPEMVEDGVHGRLAAPGDVAGLAAAIAALAGDAAASSAMGEAGRRRAAEEFSVDAHVDRMERIFREVAGR